MNNSILLFLIFIGITVRLQAQTSDSLRIDSTIKKFYQTLSFDKPDANHYDELTLFLIPQGLLISNVGKEPRFATTSEYISVSKATFRQQQITTWEEQEVCSRTEIFGKVAQRFSTYNIRIIANGKENLRSGINAIQLIKQNDTWLITSVAWDKEAPDQKIPSKYNCQ
jgi:hypothetical protein